MTFPRQISLLALMALLGLALSGCQPSDPDSPNVKQLTSTVVTPNPVNLEVGGFASLTVTGTLEDNSTFVVNSNSTFRSSAPAVATVDANTGYVTAVAPGTTTITATTETGVRFLLATTTVVVSPLRALSIDVTPATSTLAVGSAQSLVVTATYNNGTSGNVNADSTFVSSNPAVATVGASGVVSAVALGDAVITVTHTPSGKTDTAAVTVGNGGGGSTLLIIFDELPPPQLTDFGTNGDGAVIVSDPVDPGNKVLQVFKYALPLPGSEQWAGTTISTIPGSNPSDSGSIFPIPFSDTAKTMTVRVWSPAVGVRVRLKVENASNPGISVETDAITTKAFEWETLTFDFANPGLSPPVGGGPTSPLDLTKTYNRLSIFMDFGLGNGGSGPLPANRSYFVDDIAFVGGGGGGATAPTDAPATVIPAGSVTIYSDAVVTAAFDPFPNWGQDPPVTSSEETIAGNKSLKYVWAGPGGLYQGLDWSSSAVDVSGKANLHIDFWSPDVTSVKVSIISPGPVENAYTQVLTTGSWNGVDIDLSNFIADTSAIIQIKLEPATPGTLYVDNIHFSGTAGSGSCGTTEPDCAPTTAIPVGSTTIYSDAVVTAAFDPFPNWGQDPPVTSSAVTIAGNESLKYVWAGPGGLYQGLDWSSSPVDVSGKAKLHIDFWTPDLTSVKVSIISPGPVENAYTQVLTSGSWNGVDIDLSNFIANKASIIQIKLEPATPGTLYVDNIYFWGTSSGGGGAGAPADMGSGGPQTLVLSSGDSKGIFVAGEAIFAIDYKGSLEPNGNFGGFPEAHTDGTPGGGNIGYFNDTLLSTSGQKIEEGGWIVGTSLDPGGIPSFFRYFVLTAPAAEFSASYMGLYANAPNDGTLNVQSFSKIKFRLWGPAEMYQQANFNPVLEMVLSGPKVAGCDATGSGGTEITQSFTANQKIGAGSVYKLPLSGFTVKGLCGGDTAGTAVTAVLSTLSRVTVTVPPTSFNFTNANTNSNPVSYSTGVNLGPIGFTNN